MKLRTLLFSLFLTLGLFLNSCDDNTTDPSDDPDPITGNGTYTGTFLIELKSSLSGSGYSQMNGSILTYPIPSDELWEEVGKSGDCRVITPSKHFCEPTCAYPTVCVESGECKEFPTKLSASSVGITGLEMKDGGQSFDLTFVNGNYSFGATGLVYPPFAEGDDVIISAEGEDSLAAFSITTKGIDPLTLTNGSYVMEENKSIVLKWEPSQLGGTTVEVEVDISHHGGTKGLIECETADDGELEIAANLLTQLKNLGFYGFPKIDITRLASSSHSSNGISLAIKSTVSEEIDIPGLISCSDDDDCLPYGKTCTIPGLLCE